VRLLFVHPNFPGQYIHLARHYGGVPGSEVVCVGEARNLSRVQPIPGIRLLGYELGPATGTPAERARQRGQTVAHGATELRRGGFRPDVILANIGWGEALQLKEVFPESRLLLCCEFFHRARGAHFGFDPEFGEHPDEATVAMLNGPLLAALEASDCGVSATEWQKRQFPPFYQSRISVIHDGIDTNAVRPGASDLEPELITYVARNLEPLRGFHIFMRAVPEIQRRRPKARIAIVGGDGVSYSLPPRGAQSYRQLMLRELDGRIDFSRIDFLGRIPYAQYLDLLRRSAVHVYLTYPFVLSWSLLEAMSAGCLLVASRTPPVEEVVVDGENGLLMDFFSPGQLAERVDEALRRQRELQPLRDAARKTAVGRYDLRRVCLPQHLQLIEKATS
jgi:glycosyltransferase involved in cell wall biosynthesis